MHAVNPIRCLPAMLVLLGISAPSGTVSRPLAAAELRSIADVRLLSLEQLARKPVVRVRGVVSWSKGGAFTVQDGDDGIYVNLNLARKQGLMTAKFDPAAAAPGTVLEIEGKLIPGGFSAPILPHDIRMVGTAPLPAIRRTTPARFFAGADDSLLVEIEAVAQAVEDRGSTLAVTLAVDSHLFHADIARSAFPGDPARLIDANLRLAGVALTRFNTRGEILRPFVYVDRPEWLTVVSPPPQPPFEAPLIELASLARYRRETTGGHMVRIRGTVIHSMAGRDIYLQVAAGGVRVQTAAATPLALGDVVEAAGFIDRSSRVAGLANALVRKVGAGAALDPIAITADEIVAVNERASSSFVMAEPGDYENCLVTFPATLVEKRTTHRGGSLLLAAGKTNVIAELGPEDFRSLESLQPGSVVAATGIVHIESEQGMGVWPLRILSRMQLLVRNARDVRLVTPPPWWTPRRLATAAAGLAGLAAIASAWAVALRREVRRQTAIAVEEAATRREAAVEYEVTLRERNHLAANLHDTILQTVSGINFQLKVCETANSRRGDEDAAVAPDRMGEHLGVARKMVDHAAGQLRGTVWSLRSLTADGRPFGVALRELVDRTAAGHDAHTSLALDPAADDLPPLVSGNVLLVLQEALHNALHHAEPKTVAVEVRVDDAGNGIVATVRDDGCGFTLGQQVGPAQGHFGLDGMRERLERIGGTLEIKTSVGAGTTVRAAVPLRQAAGARPPARPPLAAAKLNETPSHDRTMSASG